MVGIVGAIVAFNAVLAGLDRLTRQPSGPDSSSYPTAPARLAAYSDLPQRAGPPAYAVPLARAGHPVRQLRERLDRARLGRDGTVVLLDPRDVSPSEAQALQRFVRGGGRLLAGGTQPGPWLEFLLGRRAPRWTDAPGGRARVLAPAPETAGVAALLSEGGGWAKPRTLLPLA